MQSLRMNAMRMEMRAFSSMTDNQKRYAKVLENKDVSVLIVTGPAGTGKTYLASQYAMSALRRGLYEKVVISRPLVEAGEKVGYLPGSMDEKIAPFMKPVTDLVDAKKNVSMLPLGFWRGLTFSDTLVLLDEAQNCTRAQMKMALTRLGRNSKIVITGDVGQCDLEQASGLNELVGLYIGAPKPPKTIRLVELGPNDVLRSESTKEVLELYNTRT